MDAIIDSAWWEAGFSGENGHHCLNFQVLLEERPHLALKAQNNCIQRKDSDTKVTYDFRFFEFNYYVEGMNHSILHHFFSLYECAVL